jgi:hypothetical protein
MKLFLISLLIPFSLTALCEDCCSLFYLDEYRNYYEKTALHHCNHIVHVEDLKDDREKAIFYSGASFCICEILQGHNQY